MRDYMRKYSAMKKEKAIALLGGKCWKCGSTNRMEIDHIDPKTKKFEIGKMWSRAWNKILIELKKCQLLCHDCHRIKTTIERGQTPALGTHGTLSSYRYCKCPLCRKANSDWSRNYMREYRKTHIRVCSTMVSAIAS